MSMPANNVTDPFSIADEKLDHQSAAEKCWNENKHSRLLTVGSLRKFQQVEMEYLTKVRISNPQQFWPGFPIVYFPNLGKFYLEGDVSVFYGNLFYIMAILYSLWLFGIFFPFLVCTKKNLATLSSRSSG
jgi:hypothetical protein